jgi:hypothetical protein
MTPSSQSSKETLFTVFGNRHDRDAHAAQARFLTDERSQAMSVRSWRPDAGAKLRSETGVVQKLPIGSCAALRLRAPRCKTTRIAFILDALRMAFAQALVEI